MKRFLIMSVLAFGLMLVSSVAYSHDAKIAKEEVTYVIDVDATNTLSVPVYDVDAELVPGVVILDGEYVSVDRELAVLETKARYRCRYIRPPPVAHNESAYKFKSPN